MIRFVNADIISLKDAILFADSVSGFIIVVMLGGTGLGVVKESFSLSLIIESSCSGITGKDLFNGSS